MLRVRPLHAQLGGSADAGDFSRKMACRSSRCHQWHGSAAVVRQHVRIRVMNAVAHSCRASDARYHHPSRVVSISTRPRRSSCDGPRRRGIATTATRRSSVSRFAPFGRARTPHTTCRIDDERRRHPTRSSGLLHADRPARAVPDRRSDTCSSGCESRAAASRRHQIANVKAGRLLAPAPAG